jgi:hypothetical protein
MSNEGKQTAVNFKDIVEDNGRTIEQNNLQRTHKIPLGTLVEVKGEKWGGNGYNMKFQAWLFVVGHDRDCDGTPLYKLCRRPDPEVEFEAWAEVSKGSINVKQIEFLAGVFGMFYNNYSEESLKVIEITPDVLSGKVSLNWENEEK